MTQRYDIIVIGGGHAGIEAAWAAAQLGADVALITMQREAIGRMSCNPAIGGLGKGQIVREVDALGGLMGLAIDQAGIQFRLLNRSKGPAVWAPRAQADRNSYAQTTQTLLARARSLTIVEGAVESIDTKPQPHSGAPLRHTDPSSPQSPDRVSSVTLSDGRKILGDAVVVTTGTFLRGLMHCGSAQTKGGRVGEQASGTLSGSLQSLGFTLGRLKTGTPPRVHRDSIDYEQCRRQPGDEFPTPFSDMTDHIPQRQIDCWITWTNERAHEFIRNNLDRAPMYSGQIESTGPRYCPSIEDKVVRFADKPRHQIFLEPEGYDDERIYCNGVSTSLPEDVQRAFLREVPGLERARILQFGYAVEYDWVPTHQIRSTLETKRVGGLFLAGQINGTSGYEEAAGQGLVAGVNAVARLRGDDPFVPGRDEAYLGVMIDDLITRPPSEPYRMFTSRAEYRLKLRSDNAADRLTPVGRRLGLVDDQRWRRFGQLSNATEAIRRLCDCTSIHGTKLSTWTRRPEANVGQLAEALSTKSNRIFCVTALDKWLTEAKYSGYVDRQAKQVERFRKLETVSIPAGVEYSSLAGVRLEARERWAAIEPRTLGQAGRIAGVNPADVTALWVHLCAKARARSAPS